MKRMIVWPTLGLLLGLIAFGAMFAFASRSTPDSRILMVFTVMAAIPVGIFAAVLAAFQILRDELGQIRREIDRLQKLEDLLPPPPVSSAQIKAAPGERHLQ